MDKRKLIYFVADTHLGLRVGDSAEREKRCVEFLRGIPAEETEALYLLGDIWDFWYEYRDVVPKGYVKVFAALTDLVEAGVQVVFVPGNHDIWAYSYFRELGITVKEQPFVAEHGGKRFCLGHGDGLGPVPAGYRIMRACFHSRPLQVLFSALHPWFAFRLGNGWSHSSRLAKNISYEFKGESEPLYKFCREYPQKVDFFIFGHYHTMVDMPVEGTGARLVTLGDWITAPNWLVFDGEELVSAR